MQTIQNLIGKVYSKQIVNAQKLKDFKEALTILYKNVDACALQGGPKEERQKGYFQTFLKSVLGNEYEVSLNYNRIDLVLHENADASSPISVIFEIKSTDNKDEMISDGNLNAKALHELLLYFLEQKALKQTHIQYLVALDFNDMFIFPTATFETNFYKNKELIKEFKQYKSGKLPSISTTEAFYQAVASKYIASSNLTYCHIPIRDYYEKYLNDNDKMSELYKVFSAETLLKKTVANDSNALNKKFYNELLYILGLEEKKYVSKIVLQRANKQPASLIEKTITVLKDNDKNIHSNSKFGNTYDERIYNAALELSILWLNRILFLKLLETQLYKYNSNNSSFKFLSTDKVKVFDDFNTLFFSVFGKDYGDRDVTVKAKYGHLPYLNSSLFEKSQLEWDTITMADLKDNDGLALPYFKSSILNDGQTKQLPLIEYLLSFLDAFDFSSDKNTVTSSGDRLINASVLGLIFEKINGYKDGSFFTPGTITQYMCEEAIQRAVVQKFNKVKGWKCQTLTDVNNQCKIDGVSIEEKNEIINSIRICDPAVGSGHFLVSALNEIIRIKSQLFALRHINDGALLSGNLTIENDELLVTYANGNIFTYNPKLNESQTIQETLFNEKRTIIENCLFGVDINPNSVNICRLRLWIELLKNAYYKSDGTLETLPNIDINIKCGNSLVSRIPIEIGKAVRNLSKEIKEYKSQVKKYKQENNKTEKQNVEETIRKIKAKIVQGMQLNLELDDSDATKNRLAIENSICRNSMEWMIEFPEVLDDEGRFQGFDVVIGNPPYIRPQNLPTDLKKFLQSIYRTYEKKADIYVCFMERAINLTTDKGVIAFIVSDSLLRLDSFEKIRLRILETSNINMIIDFTHDVFDAAKVKTNIISFNKGCTKDHFIQSAMIDDKMDLSVIKYRSISQSAFFDTHKHVFDLSIDEYSTKLKEKMLNNSIQLGKITDFSLSFGLKTGNDKTFLTFNPDSEVCKKLVRGADINRWTISFKGEYVIYLPFEMKKSNSTARPGSSERFEQPKVLVRDTGGGLMATFDNDNYYVKDVIIIENKLRNMLLLKTLTALLNSKVLRWYYETTFPTLHVQREELASLPIPKSIFKEDLRNITCLVDQILELKKENTPAEDLEQKIDLLAYKLYNLNYDEVLIVDPETTMAKEEYEGVIL